MMDRHEPPWHTRREFLYAGLALPATFVLASYVNRTMWPAMPKVFAQQLPLPPTPACGADPDTTPRQTEGPYYKRRSPEGTSLLEGGIMGTPLVLTGYVLSRACTPVERALLDFWQADNAGHYDNKGYRLRGHQFTDEAGRFHLETIVPGLYSGRTRHIHVKVQAPHRSILTTQLYFPGEPRNATDRIFDPNLLMTVQETTDGKAASFNFILDIT
jgi:protocatechuate 3,4-dioxygenase beta subunit